MTQISVAKQGNLTDEMKIVAKSEKINIDVVKRRVKSGKIVIPHNPIHSPNPLGIGKGLRVKVNSNIGTSREHIDVDEEIQKALVSVDAKAHAVMDLSTGGDLDLIRTSILDTIKVSMTHRCTFFGGNTG